MTIVLLLLILIGVGIVLVKVPLEPTMRWMIIAVVVVVTVCFLLYYAGIIGGDGRSIEVTTPQIR